MLTLIRFTVVLVLLLVGLARPGSAQDLVVEGGPVVLDSIEVHLVGGGDSGAGLGTAGNSGAGLLGIRMLREDDFSLNVLLHLGNQRVIASDGEAQVGTFLLNPHLEGIGVLAEGSTEREVAIGSLGVRGRAGVSFVDIRSVDNDLVEASLFYGSLSLEWMTSPSESGDTKARFGLSAGYTFRTLFSDIAQETRRGFRGTNIGSEDTSFSDGYFGFFARVKNVRPFIRFHSFDAPGITGFDGWQPVVGLEVLGSMFKTHLGS